VVRTDGSGKERKARKTSKTSGTMYMTLKCVNSKGYGLVSWRYEIQ
jgi:hypothetical protein